MPRSRDVQLSFLAYQARLDFELYYDLDLPKLSKQNIARLRVLLHDSRPEGLTPQEVHLVQLVFEHSKFSHGTEYLETIHNNQDTLQSLQMRVRAQQQTQNRHTRVGSRTDSYVFFAYGKHIPSFLEQNIDKVTFNPSYLQGNNTLLYQRAFVTWSPGAGVERRTSSPLLLGDCKFYHQHTSNTDKHYIYQREGQVPQIWSVTANQEILYGKDILWGLAYQMVLHLRYIGGVYQQQVLADLSVERFELLQEIFMPVSSYPELKIPLQFNIADEGVKIVQAVRADPTQASSFTEQVIQGFHENARAGKTLSSYLDREMVLYQNPALAITDHDKKLLLIISVKKANLQLIEKILNENNFDVNEDYVNDTLLNYAIDSIDDPDDRMSVVKFLIARGANPNNKDEEGKNTYYYAVKQQDKALFEYLLNVSCVHPKDPEIKTLPILNKDKEMLIEDSLLDLICSKGWVDWLRLAIAHGANIHHLPCTLYRGAAANNHVSMVAELIAQGARLDETKGIKTPLIIFAEQGNEEGVRLLLQHQVDVYVQYDWITAYDYAVKNDHQAVINLLKPFHAQVTQVQYKEKKQATVAIVTAEDSKTGQRVVLVGRRRNPDNTLDEEYRFPGGLVDDEDKQDYIKAAIRELKEETGINLDSEKLTEQYSQQTFATYTQIYEERYYDIRFIHFHLFIDPKSLRIKADDDLGHVKWLPVQNMRIAQDQYEKKRYLFQEEGLYTAFDQTNGIILEGLYYGGLDKSAFDLAMLVDNFGYKKLMEYTRADDIANIKNLIKHRAPVHGDLLRLAAQSGARQAVKFYLDFAPAWMDTNPHPAVSAALADQWDIFDLLNDGKMDAYSEGLILEHCIRSKNLLKVIFCLNHLKKININARLDAHQYFLTTAVMMGDLKIVQILIAHGAKLNPEFVGVDDNGISVKAPLHVAITHTHADIAIYLIDKGADINSPDNITTEALMKGSYMRMVKVVQFIHQDSPLAPIEMHDRFDLGMFNRNTNSLTKAVITTGCEKVVRYIIDHKLQSIDVNQLDRGTLTRYKEYYPELFALLPPAKESDDSFRKYYLFLN